MKLIDTHAHLQLEQFDADRAEVIARARQAGVVCQIEIGYDLASSHAAIALAEQDPAIYAVVGIQPNHIAEAPPDWLEQVRVLAKHPRVVAIGEIGLDYYWKKAEPALQEQFFREQLALARSMGLPVVIHSREAADDTLRILRAAARGQAGVMHAFSGDATYAAACLEVGFMLSFAGPLTFAKSLALHEAARHTPLNMILTETDSPYLSPHPLRGRRNEPAHVRLVAEKLAVLRTMPLDELAEAVWENACRVFQIRN